MKIKILRAVSGTKELYINNCYYARSLGKSVMEIRTQMSEHENAGRNSIGHTEAKKKNFLFRL